MNPKIFVMAVLLFFTASSVAQLDILQPTASERKVLEFHRYSKKLAHRDPTPRLTIFDSGRVVLYFPAYRRRAGIYQTVIPATELDSILQKLMDLGVGSVTADTLSRERELAVTARRNRGQLFYNSDATVTTIELFQPGSGSTGAISNHIVWDNLQSDASRFSQMDKLQNLAEAERFLLDFVDTIDVQQVGKATDIKALGR